LYGFFYLLMRVWYWSHTLIFSGSICLFMCISVHCFMKSSTQMVYIHIHT
jgi:hypothetical protein